MLLLFIYFKDGRTPLHIATRAGKLQIVDYLLKAGAHINQETLVRAVPGDIIKGIGRGYWGAARAGSLEIVECLLKAGAHINQQT